MQFEYYIPTRILFGPGKLGELHKQALPGKKAMIVISSGKSTRANGYLARVEQELDQAGVAHIVYDKILPNPVKRLGLYLRRHRKESAAGASAPARGCHYHHRRHRYRGRSLDRHHQGGNQRKDRLRRGWVLSRSFHCGSRADDHRPPGSDSLSGV